ncbi:Glu/Leu/Phe/Val dehydrogenase [Bradyrhizobium sediminis]|uniref:Glutamate dehydrogenase n=1 Tax=Bradyrhizobium sediminis TaxID=2840469 RepID=A0A975RT16_9BRAD|nr:Glu/Leu/Phe/Val dehydrogenase [Bradyrhizobium sediminis]QWG18316.1 Glu/Leu/Phe/Val dehydrogenase [Bradyrhizobium sediminis]
MEDMFRFADDFGPARIIHICRPSLALKAIVVIDNTACGAGIGGVRMAPDVSVEECFRLARAMTWKNAAAGLPHGGGKSVIFGNPRMAGALKEQLIRAFADGIRDITDYIPGPDMGTDEQCMAWVKDEIGRAVGLPAALGGIPLDEIGATGFGLAACVDVASEFIGLDLKGARIAVQGFGAVGKHAALFLAQKGALLVAASDTGGTLADPSGLDVGALIALKEAGRSLNDHDKGSKLAADTILDIDCDIWIPAARPDVVRADNVSRLRTRLMVQGANIPCTPEAERALHERGVLVIPDFIANAGGVICASVESRGGTQRAAFDDIDERIRANVRTVLEESRRQKALPRAAAVALAERRVRAAMQTRRWR